MSRFFQLKSYFNHWLNAVDTHSIHSPFFFDFYNKVIKTDKDSSEFQVIEVIRKKLLASHKIITVKDLGARSSQFTNENRPLSKIAASSLSPASFARLYSRIIRYQDARQVIELGTSLGITTLYLAHQDTIQVTTFEGNAAMIEVARTHIEFLRKQNIQLIEGNIDTTLADFLLTPVKIDFALMDANHRYEPTIRYFNLLTRRMAEKGIIVMDDIYYSEEMNQAWKEISNHPLVYGSIDLFRCGLLFFDPALNRQQYTWAY